MIIFCFYFLLFMVYTLRSYFNCLIVYWAQNTSEILEKEATIESSPMLWVPRNTGNSCHGTSWDASITSWATLWPTSVCYWSREYLMWLELAHDGSKPLSQFGSFCLIFDSKWLDLTQVGSNRLKIVALIIVATYSISAFLSGLWYNL